MRNTGRMHYHGTHRGWAQHSENELSWYTSGVGATFGELIIMVHIGGGRNIRRMNYHGTHRGWAQHSENELSWNTSGVGATLGE